MLSWVFRSLGIGDVELWHAFGAVYFSPVPSYWPHCSFWRRGQGWRLRQRGAPPKAPLRPAPERGQSPTEGATAGDGFLSDVESAVFRLDLCAFEIGTCAAFLVGRYLTVLN